MRLALLGFGLIGGSIARALHARGTDWTTVAWSPSGAGPVRAAADGVISHAAATAGEAVAGADVVVLAAPPLACLDLLEMLAGPLRARLARDPVITDVASTKRRIVARAGELGLPFAGGHPMAGLETTGYGAADPELFVGRPWVVCADDEGGRLAAGVEMLARDVGAVPVHLSAGVHDAAVAAVSHVPLVVAAALAEAVLASDAPPHDPARRLAAGGWASMTRLARGDVEMGTGILATNADEVAARLRLVRSVLDGWLAELDRDEPDADSIGRRLAGARALLETPG